MLIHRRHKKIGNLVADRLIGAARSNRIVCPVIPDALNAFRNAAEIASMSACAHSATSWTGSKPSRRWSSS